MKQETAEIIEKQRNVYVDAKAGMYTTGNRADTYGWLPVPSAWVDEVEEVKREVTL